MGIFATRLKELRATQSQAAFASAIGVNRVQYAKYESGQNSPSIDFLERICRAMPGVSADWLLGLKDRGTSVNAGTGAYPPSGASPRSGCPSRGVVARPGLPAAALAKAGDAPLCSRCPYKKRLAKIEKAMKA